MMKSAKFIVVLIVLAFGVTTKMKAQADYTYSLLGKNYMLKTLFIHTDTFLIKFSIIEDEVKVKTVPELEYFWHKNRKILSNRGGIGGDLLEGSYTVYDKGDNLIEQGHFYRGLKHGEWRKWNSSGELVYIKEYKKGLQHGKSIVYAGKVTELKYRKGVLVTDSKSESNKPVLKEEKKKAGNENDNASGAGSNKNRSNE